MKDHDNRFCYCGLSKSNVHDDGCTIWTGNVMQLVRQSVAAGKVNNELKQITK